MDTRSRERRRTVAIPIGGLFFEVGPEVRLATDNLCAIHVHDRYTETLEYLGRCDDEGPGDRPAHAWPAGLVMNNEQGVEQAVISVLFTMLRDDDPDLHDDLVRFKQGYRRVNRLRLLAHDGLKGPVRDKRTNAGPTTPMSLDEKGRTFELLDAPID